MSKSSSKNSQDKFDNWIFHIKLPKLIVKISLLKWLVLPKYLPKIFLAQMSNMWCYRVDWKSKNYCTYVLYVMRFVSRMKKMYIVNIMWIWEYCHTNLYFFLEFLKKNKLNILSWVMVTLSSNFNIIQKNADNFHTLYLD